MSDHHGGFYVLRDDREIAASVRELAIDYLGDTEQLADLNLVWSGRSGVGALFVTLTTLGERPGEWSKNWVAHNLAFGARIAREARAPTWAYTYDNIAGEESVTRFGGDGTVSHEEQTDWDLDEDRAVDAIADELDAPRVLLEYDMPFATPLFVQPLSEPFDEFAFDEWLSERPTVVWPHNAQFVVLHLQADAAEELDAAAARLNVRPGDVIDAIWETCKPEVFATIAIAGREDMEGPDAYLDPPPSRPPPVQLGERADAPDLDPASPKQPVRLALHPDTIREMQELALAADRSQSWVLQRTYEIGRNRLREE